MDPVIEPPSHPRMLDARFAKTNQGEAYLHLDLKADGIFVVSMIRGKTHPFDDQNFLAVADALLWAESNPDVLVVVLTGSRDYFTSGADLDKATDTSFKLGKGFVNDPTGVFMRITARFPKLLVAAVSGPAIGVGATLLPHCDIVYASEKAYFWSPFSRIALLPEFGSSYTFPRVFGTSVANELIMLSKKLSTSRAKELGFVSDVFPSDGFLDRVLTEIRAGLVYPLMDKSLPLFKSVIKKWDAEVINSAILEELRVLDERIDRGEPTEAIMEFLQNEAKKKLSASAKL